MAIYGCVGALYRPSLLENLKTDIWPSAKQKKVIISTNTLQFKMVCKRGVKFMEELVVWDFLKCVAFFLGFCKICLHRQLRKNNQEFTRSLFTRSNTLYRIAFCLSKNDICVNLFPYARRLIYYHPSSLLYSDRFSLSLMPLRTLIFSKLDTQVSLLAFCIMRRDMFLVPRIFSIF